MTTNYFYKNLKSKFIKVTGKDAASFIQNLITNDINLLKKNFFLYSCFLTPQGKFIADFFIFKDNNNFIFEIHEKYHEALLEKFRLYKLKSKVEISSVNTMNSFVIFNKINLYHNYIIFNNDPRNKNIGKKLIQNSPTLENIKEINEKEYHALLIKNKVPYSPYDLQQQKSLLLENNFDNLNAISWDKGCYIGQEITARMKYRALLKKKLYALKIVSGSISTGEKIYNNGNTLGEVISRSNQYLFCMLRIEFVEEKSLNKKLLKINSTVTLQFL